MNLKKIIVVSIIITTAHMNAMHKFASDHAATVYKLQCPWTYIGVSKEKRDLCELLRKSTKHLQRLEEVYNNMIQDSTTCDEEVTDASINICNDKIFPNALAYVTLISHKIEKIDKQNA